VTIEEYNTITHIVFGNSSSVKDGVLYILKKNKDLMIGSEVVFLASKWTTVNVEPE
jgi:hypothetical protein